MRKLSLIVALLTLVLASPLPLDSDASGRPAARPPADPVAARPTLPPTAHYGPHPATDPAPGPATAAPGPPAPGDEPFTLPSDPPPVGARPNIVVLMLDDMAVVEDDLWQRLPTISRVFFEHGVSFTSFWSNVPLCCPGRANFLTGQWAHHSGVTLNDGRLLDHRTTLATELNRAGYYTLLSGKYLHKLDLLADKTPRGWDGFAGMSGAYYDYTAFVDGVAEEHGLAEADYSTDVFADHSVRLLRAAPADEPVFALLTPYAPHAGSDEVGGRVVDHPPPAIRHRGDVRCAGIPPFRPASYNELDVSDKPAYVGAVPLADPAGWRLDLVCESLLSVDEWLARVVGELRRQDRLANTLFVLTTDNARSWGANRWRKKIAPYASRMPLAIRWPGVTRTQREDDALLSMVDLAPTLCEIGGCTMGPFANGFGVDGLSFAGLIAPLRYPPMPKRDAIVLEHHAPTSQVPAWRGIVTSADHPLGQWFAIHYRTIGARELYDMSGGPCERWAVGDAGDPCMMSSVAEDPPGAGLWRRLMRELRKLW